MSDPLVDGLYDRQFCVEGDKNTKNFQIYVFQLRDKKIFVCAHPQGTFFDPQRWAVKLKKNRNLSNFSKNCQKFMKIVEKFSEIFQKYVKMIKK